MSDSKEKEAAVPAEEAAPAEATLPTEESSETMESQEKTTPQENTEDWFSSGAAWGASWLTSAKQKTMSTIELMKKDMNEFREAVQTEAVAIASATADSMKQQAQQFHHDATVKSEEKTSEAEETKTSEGTSGGGFGFGWMKTIVDSVKTLGTIDTTDGEDEFTEKLSSNKILRKSTLDQCRLNQIQTNEETFTVPPNSNLDLYKQWLREFKIEEYDAEINALLSYNPRLREMYGRIVPAVVDNHSFWNRYFFRIHVAEMEQETVANERKLLETLSVDTKSHEPLTKKTSNDTSSPSDVEVVDAAAAPQNDETWSMCSSVHQDEDNGPTTPKATEIDEKEWVMINLIHYLAMLSAIADLFVNFFLVFKIFFRKGIFARDAVHYIFFLAIAGLASGLSSFPQLLVILTFNNDNCHSFKLALASVFRVFTVRLQFCLLAAFAVDRFVSISTPAFYQSFPRKQPAYLAGAVSLLLAAFEVFAFLFQNDFSGVVKSCSSSVFFGGPLYQRLNPLFNLVQVAVIFLGAFSLFVDTLPAISNEIRRLPSANFAVRWIFLFATVLLLLPVVAPLLLRFRVAITDVFPDVLVFGDLCLHLNSTVLLLIIHYVRSDLRRVVRTLRRKKVTSDTLTINTINVGENS
ncbi:hypothetical protein QR680_005348 [Steinernema hermaphroditum]|uniref:BSD domain-containing protein n=1 Tax=Steinernema hermaphroditum TaxID=289476 RepID=A0AA39HRP3_9BILA|nr:hypothetical protein QR680_005348 [Steinernema hermaphroditum]